jgi:ADP-ribosylation factor family protein
MAELSVDFDADISLSKLLDPTAWVEKAAEAYKAYRGYRLLVLGAQQVGKSTLWNYLLTGETGTSVEKTAQTQAVGGSLDDPRFRIFNMKVLGIGVGVKALDVPGDPQLRETWTHAFTRIKPQGVVFLVDHDAGPDAVADPGYTPERMAEHAQALGDMRDIVLGHAEVSENLRSVLVLVNKYDVWHHQLSYGDAVSEREVSHSCSTARSEMRRCVGARTGIRGERNQPDSPIYRSRYLK